MMPARMFRGFGHSKRGTDMPARERGARDLEPFRRRVRRVAPDDLDDLAVAERRFEGDQFSVHFHALDMVSEVAVYRIGEIDRR